MIVTTGPPSEAASQAEKRKSRFPVFSRSKSPAFPLPDPPKEKKSSPEKKNSTSKEKRKTIFGSLRTSKDESEAIDRGAKSLDLNGLLSEERSNGASSSLALPFADTDSNGPTPDPPHSMSLPQDAPPQRPKFTQAKTWLPRRKKNRESLFPLPVKIVPPEFPNTAPATPRASTSALSSSESPHRPTTESSPPHNTLRRTSTTDGVSRTSLPSPYQTLAATSIAFAAPGSALLRNDSTSARSDQSGPGLAPPLFQRPSRHRASTLGSMGAHSEDGPVPPPTPPTLGGGSGRNSTSTGGRSSFSNLLTLSHRFRQSSEPYSPRQGSPGFAGNGDASGLGSQSNSFSISRENLKVTLPDRVEGESAGKYLTRVEDSIDKSQIPSVLSTQNDDFFTTVMRSFMRKFSFFGDPLDMAIRKLLMEVDLPKETQQIDRFLQSFADRYHECNPGIFHDAGKQSAFREPCMPANIEQKKRISSHFLFLSCRQTPSIATTSGR
ncbi:MAG: hypothetical protein INR71_02770 [Terriglobus roseus]|nr:hypothetical protein [Terriglobus roseus]